MEAKLKSNRDAVKDAVKEFNETEEALKALQSVGQIIGEVLKQLDENRSRLYAHEPVSAPLTVNLPPPPRSSSKLSHAVSHHFFPASLPPSHPLFLLLIIASCRISLPFVQVHREGVVRATLCGGLPQQTRQI